MINAYRKVENIQPKINHILFNNVNNHNNINNNNYINQINNNNNEEKRK